MCKRILLQFMLIGLCLISKAASYNVMDFGAQNDGKTLTTQHIQKAIDQCYYDGGGVVYVPKGNYLVGTINLKSKVEFRFENRGNTDSNYRLITIPER